MQHGGSLETCTSELGRFAQDIIAQDVILAALVVAYLHARLSMPKVTYRLEHPETSDSSI